MRAGQEEVRATRRKAGRKGWDIGSLAVGRPLKGASRAGWLGPHFSARAHWLHPSANTGELGEQGKGSALLGLFHGWFMLAAKLMRSHTEETPSVLRNCLSPDAARQEPIGSTSYLRSPSRRFTACRPSEGMLRCGYLEPTHAPMLFALLSYASASKHKPPMRSTML